jgi:hypothetical protein
MELGIGTVVVIGLIGVVVGWRLSEERRRQAEGDAAAPRAAETPTPTGRLVWGPGFDAPTNGSTEAEEEDSLHHRDLGVVLR